MPELLDRVKEDLARIRALYKRKRRLEDLRAGKALAEHQQNIGAMYTRRMLVQDHIEEHQIDLFQIGQPSPPPGVPDSLIENYGPDGTVYRMGGG